MEVGSGFHVEPCGHGGSRASGDGDLRRDPAGHWFAHPSCCPCRISVSRQPLGHGIGHVLDLGTTGSGRRIARARRGARRSSLGHRRAAGTAEPLVPVVVMMRESACEYRSSFLPITKRRPLAVCLPICLPISSRRSSSSTAIRRTGRLRLLHAWVPELFPKLVVDTAGPHWRDSLARARPMLSYSLTATTAIGLLSFRFSS